MVVEELLTLPPWVDYQGVHFQLELFINGSKEVRLCYSITHVDDDSPHKLEFEVHQTWNNDLHRTEEPRSEGWLYLQEGIDSDATLIWAIRECWYWLQERGLLAGLGGSPYG